tara:strand:- start:74 stop:274 length:201 start_codon:yes stop_codon:yes gene_type:complete
MPGGMNKKKRPMQYGGGGTMKNKMRSYAGGGVMNMGAPMSGTMRGKPKMKDGNDLMMEMMRMKDSG